MVAHDELPLVVPAFALLLALFNRVLSGRDVPLHPVYLGSSATHCYGWILAQCVAPGLTLDATLENKRLHPAGRDSQSQTRDRVVPYK